MNASSSPRAGLAKYRVLVVDDHPIVHQGLARLIDDEPDIEICGSAEDIAGALARLACVRPDLVVVDIALKSEDGLDLIGEVRARFPRMKILVWSMFDEAFFAERALRAGAAGYISKRQPIAEVAKAIRCVLGGEVYLSPQMTSQVLRRVGGIQQGQEPVETLSNREFQVFQMIGQGLTTQQIAANLLLSVKTVEGYRENVKAKLDLKNSAELNHRAVEWVVRHR